MVGGGSYAYCWPCCVYAATGPLWKPVFRGWGWEEVEYADKISLDILRKKIQICRNNEEILTFFYFLGRKQFLISLHCYLNPLSQVSYLSLSLPSFFKYLTERAEASFFCELENLMFPYQLNDVFCFSCRHNQAEAKLNKRSTKSEMPAEAQVQGA